MPKRTINEPLVKSPSAGVPVKSTVEKPPPAKELETTSPIFEPSCKLPS